MKITIRLLAGYRRYLPKDHDTQAGYEHKVSPGCKVGDLLAELPIPDDDLYTYLVNGSHAQRTQVLQENDILAIFPAVGGG